MKRKLSLIKFIVLLILSSLNFLSCEPSVNPTSESSKEEPSKESSEKQVFSLSGYVQKGPFISGSEISIYELDSSLNQTGRTFLTAITDNRGSFSINEIETSPFAKIVARGFYFNENDGQLSQAPISLNAIIDLNKSQTVNVNLLTHLESFRVEALVKENHSFDSAKAMARNEIINEFFGTSSIEQEFEALDLSKQGEENAQLFAVSILLQGNKSDAEISERLSKLSLGFAGSGKILDSIILSSMVSELHLLDKNVPNENLKKRLSDLGENTELPNYLPYLEKFSLKYDSLIKPLIVYPETGSYGPNLLYDSLQNGLENIKSFTAETPNGIPLKLRLIASGNVMWYYEPSKKINWQVEQFDAPSGTQWFTVINPGEISELPIGFDLTRAFVICLPEDIKNKVCEGITGDDTVTIEYYEGAIQKDNQGNLIPTRTKTIT